MISLTHSRNRRSKTPESSCSCRVFPRWTCCARKLRFQNATQELTVARTSLQLQQTLMKNAITKSLDDPTLEAMPVIPTDRIQTVAD